MWSLLPVCHCPCTGVARKIEIAKFVFVYTRKLQGSRCPQRHSWRRQWLVGRLYNTCISQFKCTVYGLLLWNAAKRKNSEQTSRRIGIFAIFTNYRLPAWLLLIAAVSYSLPSRRKPRVTMRSLMLQWTLYVLRPAQSQLAFLPRDAMHTTQRRLYCSKMSACLCVCPSHAGILSKRLHIISNYFTIAYPHHSSLFPHQTVR